MKTQNTIRAKKTVTTKDHGCEFSLNIKWDGSEVSEKFLKDLLEDNTTILKKKVQKLIKYHFKLKP